MVPGAGARFKLGDRRRPRGKSGTLSEPEPSPSPENLMSRTRQSLRHFLGHTAGALAAPLIVPASCLGREDRPAPGKRITVGAIGCGNMGMGDIKGLLADDRVQVVAVCDVNKES